MDDTIRLKVNVIKYLQGEDCYAMYFVGNFKKILEKCTGSLEDNVK